MVGSLGAASPPVEPPLLGRRYWCKSLPHMPEAFISTTTSPSPGVGSGNCISSSWRSPVKTTPRIPSSASLLAKRSAASLARFAEPGYWQGRRSTPRQVAASRSRSAAFPLIAKAPLGIGERASARPSQNHCEIFCSDNAIKAAARKRRSIAEWLHWRRKAASIRVVETGAGQMIDIAPEAASRLPGGGLLSQGPAQPVSSTRELYRRLVWLYVRASVAAVIVMFTLVLLGLDLSLEQWAYIIVATPIGVGIYVLPDIYVIGRQFRLIGDTLNRLDRGEVPGPAEISRTLVHALNLPFYSFVRVTFMHGPLATISILTIMIAANYLFGAEYALWQMLIFASAALFFASPTHAIVEYFSIVHELAGPITRMSPLAVEGILPEDQQRLVSIKLRSKLLYLSIFIAGLPLLFFACSILFKVDRMVRQSGIMLPESELLPLWLWVIGVVVICLVLALSMAIFIAAEVSRSAATLADAMRQVESGELDLDLHITSTE